MLAQLATTALQALNQELSTPVQLDHITPSLKDLQMLIAYLVIQVKCA